MDVPAQTVVPGLEVMFTEGVTEGVTVNVMDAEVALEGFAQEELEVITTLT